MARYNENEYDYLFKIVLIGDSGVGKTNILQRFVKSEFSLEGKPTIGVEFSTKTISVQGKGVKCQIWDTAGQERYRAITNAYYRGAVGALVCFDVTRDQTFQNTEKWLGELKEHADKNIAIMMIANKIDLNNERIVRSAEATELCQNQKIGYIETSAKDGTNIEQAFVNLISGNRYFKNQEVFNQIQTQKQNKTPDVITSDVLVLDEQKQQKKDKKKQQESCCQ